MAHPVRNISDEGIESLDASQAVNELFQRESRNDLASIWWVSLGMATFFLILVFLLIQDAFSWPKNRNPTESTWYCQTLPLFSILSQDRRNSLRPATCRNLTFLPFTEP